MDAAEHRIGRVVFEIAATDSADITLFCEKLRARFDAVALPALQAALDRIDRPDRCIRLGRVDVDLGTLNSPEPSAQELARHLTEGLVSALRATPVTETADSPRISDDVEELIEFLENGELPWSEPGLALSNLAATLMALDGAGMSRLASRLRVVLNRRRNVERLVRQLPTVLLRRILLALLPDVLATPLNMAFGQEGLKEAGEGIVSPVPEALIPGLMETILRLARGSVLPDPSEIVALFSALDGRVPLSTVVASPRLPMSSEATLPIPAAMDDATSELVTNETDSAASASVRPVYAAGAVLLHPFLATLFDRLGLLAASGRFLNPAARGRAVLLAHHLASGAEEVPEPETTLFKLLCGMPLVEPVPRRLELTTADRAEIQALLNSVIDHWQRLGHTSPAALREGFLNRPGRLEHHDGRWRLSVESRGIDVLLDDLPWALSRIKTPFMNVLLTVDWL